MPVADEELVADEEPVADEEAVAVEEALRRRTGLLDCHHQVLYDQLPAVT